MGLVFSKTSEQKWINSMGGAMGKILVFHWKKVCTKIKELEQELEKELELELELELLN